MEDLGSGGLAVWRIGGLWGFEGGNLEVRRGKMDRDESDEGRDGGALVLEGVWISTGPAGVVVMYLGWLRLVWRGGLAGRVVLVVYQGEAGMGGGGERLERRGEGELGEGEIVSGDGVDGWMVDGDGWMVDGGWYTVRSE